MREADGGKGVWLIATLRTDAVNGASLAQEYYYDENGKMTVDLNKNITTIKYII